MAEISTSLLTIGIPCRVDEPSLEGTLDSLVAACRHPELSVGLCIEIVLCVNGWQEGMPSPPLDAVLQVSTRLAVPLRQYGGGAERPGGEEPPLRLTVLRSPRLGKALAWNLIRRWSAGDLILFCDADVRVNGEAVAALHSRLRSSPELRLVASKEVPVVTAGDAWLRRAAALPYRFYFHNVTGRLYIIRRNALAGDMAEGLLFEDAWLTLAVGRRWIAQEPRAQAFFLPPATWRDWVAERVRTEAGKLQIRRAHPDLLADGPAAAYPWWAFVRRLRPAEWPLLCLLLGMRLYARLRARRKLRDGEGQQLWQVVESSKQWPPPR